MSDPKIAMKESDLVATARIFNVLLADLYVLYTKLRNFHWNVEDPNFVTYHRLFEEQFITVLGEIDEVAEIVRQKGEVALGSMKEFTSNCRLFEQPGGSLDAKKMLTQILEDHEALIRYMRADSDILDEKYKDIVGQDFLIKYMENHLKMAWFLRSTLN